MTEKSITQDKLKKLISYNPDTGEFFRLVSLSNSSKIGKVTGYKTDFGYIRLCVDGKQYFAHRLAWLYIYGEFPSSVIDHIDQNPSNNKISNLRTVSIKQNLENRNKPKNNKSGFKGVSWSKSVNKWIAMIGHKNQQIYLGAYKNIHDADHAYQNAAKKYHTHKPL